MQFWLLRHFFIVCAFILLPAATVQADALQDARSFWDHGQLTAAVFVLKERIDEAPDDWSARLMLAEVLLDLYQVPAVQTELDRAVQAGAPRDRVLRPRARAWLLQQEYEQLLREVTIASASDALTQAELAALRGEAHRGLGDDDAAMAEYERALSIHPTQPDAMMGKARLALSQQRVEDARALLVEAAQASSDAARVWELLGEVDFAVGDYEAAERSFVKAVIAGRNKWMPRYKRALTRLELNDLDGARQDIEAVAGQLPKFPGLLFARGALKLRSGEVDAGLTLLGRYLEVDPGNIRALYLAALGEVQRGNVDLGIDMLNRYIKAMPDSIHANRALGEALLLSREITEAERVARRALREHPENATLHALLARSLARQGRLEEAMEALREASRNAPDSADYRVAAAETLEELGRLDEALAELDAALELEPLHDAAPLLRIKILLEQRAFDQAVRSAERLAMARPRSPHALNALGLARLAANDELGARTAFEEAIAMDPTFADAPLNLARLALSKGDTNAARFLLERVLERESSHVEATLALAELDAAAGDTQAQQARLQDALDAYPAERRFLLALARSYLANGNPESATSVLQSAKETLRQHPEVMLVLAQAQLGAGLLKSATETLQALSLAAPESATAVYLLAITAARRENELAMEDSLAQAVAMDPKSPLLQSALSAAFEYYNSAQERVDLIDRLLGVAPGDPRLIAVKADLYTEIGEHQRAARLMSDLLGRYPDDAGVLRKLVAVHLAGGAHAEAEAVLNSWLESHADDATAQVVLSQILVETGREEQALELLQGLMERDQSLAGNSLLLNNLAWLLRDVDPEQALTYAERAFRTDAQSPAVKDTLGLLLVRAGSVERGVHLLHEAKAARPSDPDIALHLAEGLVQAGRDSEARLLLLNLVSQDFAGRETAQALLDKMGG